MLLLINTNLASQYKLAHKHFCVCVCIVIVTDDVAACKEPKSTTRDEVEWRDCTSCDVFCDLLHTEKCKKEKQVC